MNRTLTTLILAFIVMPCPSFALDKNGKFESMDEQNKFISASLRDLAVELNSQTPMMLDSETQFTNALTLFKTINFTYRLVNVSSKAVTPNALILLNKNILANMNDNACKVQATRYLMDMGVTYVYLYFGNDDRLITRVELNKYSCN